jgi:hypothetical protein
MTYVVELDPETATTRKQLGLSDLEVGCAPMFQRRDMMPMDFLEGETSTLGWDMSYAIRLPDVNAAILKEKAWPPTFQIDVDPQEDYTLSGHFGPWQMIRGGSSGIVMLAIGIASGVMTVSEEGEQRKYLMDGSTAIVSVKLRYAAAPVPDLRPVAERMFLAINPDARSSADPAVVVHGFEFPRSAPSPYVQTLMKTRSAPSPYVQTLMKAGLEIWFNNNIQKFSHIFAIVNLNETVTDAFQWLKPTYTGYAYLDGSTDEESSFGVLGMAENRSADGLANQLGPNCVPKASRAGFSIGTPRYLEKVVLPGLIKTFTKATISGFTLTGNNSVIVNTGAFEVDPIVVNGTSYTPKVEIFELQVLGEELQIHTRTKIPISLGIRAMVDSVTYQKIILVDKPDGSHTLDFKESRPMVTNHWIEVDDGVKITQIIVSLVGAVAGAASEAFDQIAKVIIAAVIITIVAGVVNLIPELIAEVAGGNAAKVLPPIGQFATGATDPVKWPGGGQFTLTEAGLNGAFQFGGNPHFQFTV